MSRRPTLPTVPRRRGRRVGFTLIELLGVIAVISILLALLAPAVQRAFRTARIAQIVTEISALETAIANFKTEFGFDPPSRLDLALAAVDPTVATPVAKPDRQFTPETSALLRRMFPNIDLTTDSDSNGTIDARDALEAAGFPVASAVEPSAGATVKGSACLVFFLGGVDRDAMLGTTFGPTGTPAGVPDLIGFSKNPTNPFESASSNRIGPFFDFAVSRLDGPLAGSSLSDDIGGGSVTFNYQYWVYFDPYPSQVRPYAYASTSSTGSYFTSATADTDSNGLISQAEWDALSDGSDIPVLAKVSSSGFVSEPYRQVGAAKFWNPSSFQIVSPGPDGAYGTGGIYDPAGESELGVSDADNVTNFSGGTLGG